MVEKIIDPEGHEQKFYRFVISEYLKYGSVDEVFKRNDYNLPISYMGVHRLIDRWGIVKAAGPNSKLSEAITFLVLLSDKKIPLERLYRFLPLSFKTSMATMHRILHNIKEGVVRRAGTALILVPEGNPTRILIGEDISTPRLELGKPYGSLSLPMGYSKIEESANDSILRVLQQEVFTQQTIGREFPPHIIPDQPRPFLYFDIADLRVSVYRLFLPANISAEENFSSFKIRNHRYLALSEMVDNFSKYNFRAGIKEIATAYGKYLLSPNYSPFIEKAVLNLELQDLALEYLYR